MSQLARNHSITSEDSLHSLMNKVAALEINAIEQTKKAINLDQLKRVAQLLKEATCINFYAFDHNLHLAKMASSHFYMRENKPLFMTVLMLSLCKLLLR